MRSGLSALRPLLFAIVGSVALPALTMAQDAPETPWGAPDLQGVWDFRTITPLQRPEDLGDKAFLTEEEAAQREQGAVDRAVRLWERDARRTEAGGNVGGYNNFWMDPGTNVIGTRRTSLIIDPPNGRFPALTDAGQARQRADRGSFTIESPTTYTDLNTYDRCIQGFNAGPPIAPGGYNQNVQIFQTQGHLVMMTEMVHTVRVIPLDGRPHLGSGVSQWSGDSRGHWEGDTLVVESTNFAQKRNWRGSTNGMTLVERFRRVDDTTLEYEYTVMDPETWTSPWTVNLPMRLNPEAMFEYACHEGNYSMEAMLGGARAEERVVAGGQ
ncbi:MAG: hypothetical protein VX453_12960 [Acidobacteriota bacterium]|nr:hypothetical protein [Acidobacteriota bacterium]